MGVSNTHALGRNLKFFVKDEVTPGTFIKPTSADAAKVLKFDVTPDTERKPREDSRASRSVLERITGRSKYSWVVEAYLIPSGTAGTPPDLHALFKAILSTYNNTPGTKDDYAPSSSQTVPTMSMCGLYNDILMHTIWGAAVDSFSLSVKGADPATVKWEGQAMGYAVTGNSTLNGAMVASPTMVVQAAQGWSFSKNSVVKIDADDNAGAGWKVTADTARPSFTIEGNASGGNNNPVVPFVPTETVAGNPIAGIAGSFTVDGVAMPIKSFEMTAKANNKWVDDEALVAAPTDVIPGIWDWSGEFSIRARKDFIVELGKRQSFSTRDLALVIGSAAGKRCKVDLDFIEIDFAGVEYSNDDAAVIKLPFTVLGSSGNDEGHLSFD